MLQVISGTTIPPRTAWGLFWTYLLELTFELTVLYLTYNVNVYVINRAIVRKLKHTKKVRKLYWSLCHWSVLYLQMTTSRELFFIDVSRNTAALQLCSLPMMCLFWLHNQQPNLLLKGWYAMTASSVYMVKLCNIKRRLWDINKMLNFSYKQN